MYYNRASIPLEKNLILWEKKFSLLSPVFLSHLLFVLLSFPSFFLPLFQVKTATSYHQHKIFWVFPCILAREKDGVRFS
jgi:hypothetical protein